jgi:hypothetical protein
MKKAIVIIIAILAALIVTLAICWVPLSALWKGEKGEPETVTVTETAEILASLNDPFIAGDSNVNVTSVVEDSRCPSDVQCIQAGRVIISLDIDAPTGTSTTQMESGETIALGDWSLTLTDVTPYPVSTAMASSSDYRFSFTVIK